MANGMACSTSRLVSLMMAPSRSCAYALRCGLNRNPMPPPDIPPSIQKPGELAGRVLEIGGLVGHAAGGELVAEDFEIARLEHAGVAGDFVVAGVDGPLSEFVRHQRHGDGAHAGGGIEIGAALAAPETRAVDAQAAHRGLLRHVVIGRGTGGAAAMVGGEGV